MMPLKVEKNVLVAHIFLKT